MKPSRLAHSLLEKSDGAELLYHGKHSGTTLSHGTRWYGTHGARMLSLEQKRFPFALICVMQLTGVGCSALICKTQPLICKTQPGVDPRCSHPSTCNEVGEGLRMQ